MARAPDPRVEQAEAMFRQGKKLIEIAAALDVPEGTVRSWKKRYGWDSSGNATLQKSRRNVAKKKNIERKAMKKEVVADLAGRAIENPELTEKQQLFCVLYVFGDSATAAYQKAYGCSYNTAAVQACRSLKAPKIRAEVERLKKERFEAQLFNEHDIFQWYLDVAQAAITDFVTFGRELVPVMGAFGPVVDKETGKPIMKEINYVKFRESAEVNGHVIKKVKLGKEGASIELYDAAAAMDWLSKHMGMGTNAQQTLAQNIIGAYEQRKQEQERNSQE